MAELPVAFINSSPQYFRHSLSVRSNPTDSQELVAVARFTVIAVITGSGCLVGGYCVTQMKSGNQLFSSCSCS